MIFRGLYLFGGFFFLGGGGGGWGGITQSPLCIDIIFLTCINHTKVIGHLIIW